MNFKHAGCQKHTTDIQKGATLKPTEVQLKFEMHRLPSDLEFLFGTTLQS